MFHVIGAMAEFERALIQERVKAGLARAKRAGRRGGRPKRMWHPKTERRVKQLRTEGKSWQHISRKVRIPVGTLHAKFRDPPPASRKHDLGPQGLPKRWTPRNRLSISSFGWWPMVNRCLARTCTEGSNPSPSATQSWLQRNLAAVP